jgi:hypothetical protein
MKNYFLVRVDFEKPKQITIHTVANLWTPSNSWFGAAILNDSIWKYSQTCVQRSPLGPEKRGRYAEGCMKKISGK